MCHSLYTRGDFSYNKKLVFAVAAIVIGIITGDMIISSFYDVLTSILLPNVMLFQTSTSVSAATILIILFVAITAVTYGVGWPFFSALIDNAEKTSKFGLNEYSVQDEKLTCTCIHKSVLIIDCQWHGCGGMGDKFDFIIAPTGIARLSAGSVRCS